MVSAIPDVTGVERHLLDEAQLVAVLERESQQVGGLVVVDAAHQHRVDLHWRQSGVGRRGQAVQHVGEPVAAGQRLETGRIECVDRDVDAIEAGLEPAGRRVG